MTEIYSPESLHGQEGPELQSQLRYWYLLTISGAIAVGVGVLVLAKPSRSLKALAVILGVYLLAVGALRIARTVSDDERGAGGLLVGILALIAGAVVTRHPGGSIVAVSLALGIYFLVAGALNLARAIIGPRRLFSLIEGVVLVAAGTVITSSPEISVKTLALLTSISLCLQGAVQICESLVLRSLNRDATR
jgi:uncharacterized membrane protein HdeD (DUF308 family)